MNAALAQMMALMGISKTYGNPFLQRRLNQRQKRKLNRQTGRYPKR